ncbi:hypothetical protein ACFVWY_21790 [Streptomyces sp. NPDC058195]|uniref:hypothetical protein n=1 Tax=Streptomyces sp. NPDC058195 TaxID=3346375 RepID=UPI0036DFB05B
MDNARFLDLLENLCRRPAMFTGERTVESVSVFLTGYFIGVSHAAPEEPGLPMDSGWSRWIETRYDVFHPAWPWRRILLHHHADDQGVFEVLPSLYGQFLAERDACGTDGIEARHQDRFKGRSPVPAHTHTVDPR